MDHREMNLEATGAFLRVTPEHRAAYGLAAQLISALQPPLGAPFAKDIVKLLLSAITYSVSHLEDPTAGALRIKDNFGALATVLDTAQTGIQTSSSRLSLRGKASTNPIWYQLASAITKSSETNPLLLYVGSSVLLSIHHNKPIPRGAAPHIQQAAEVELSEATLNALISGFAPQDLLGLGWTTKLAKMWREVLKVYSAGVVPPPTLQNRIAGQLLGAALNPTPAHVAGAQSHSQLSHRQLAIAASHIKEWSDRDELAGALGVLAVRTGLSTDVLIQLPLESGMRSYTGVRLDPLKGVLWIDFHPLVFEPAQSLPGCYSGGFLLCIHLPANTAIHLRNRVLRYPSAASLMDLFPGEEQVLTTDGVYESCEEIAPTWARLRRSTGPMLLHGNFNALQVALLTLDFSLICRSKLHYSRLSAYEWHAAEARLYKLLNWDSPVEIAVDEPGIGSRVVPTDLTVVQHDISMLNALHACHPGKHSSLAGLVDFHNQYTLLTGWRLGVLLALRASSELAIPASIGDGSNWVAVHDKSTRNDRGHQPVPLCDFTLETVRLFRHHCAAMAARLAKLQMGNQPAARWCNAVSQGRNQRLLCTLTATGEVKAVASHTCCKPFASTYALPEDSGRKIMENALRAEGLPSVLIDQMLRHSHAGQIHLSNFNLAPMGTSMERLRRAVERIAERLFSTPVAGLRKE